MADDIQPNGQNDPSSTPNGDSSSQGSDKNDLPVRQERGLLKPENSTQERFTWSMLRQGLFSFFQLEKGLLHTLRDLAIRPGTMLRSYLFSDERERYTNPIGFIVLSSAIVAFLMFRFGDFEAFSIDSQRNKRIALETADSLQNRNDTLTTLVDTAALLTDNVTNTENAQTDSVSTSLDAAAQAKADAEKKEAIVTSVAEVYSTLMAKYYNIMMLLGVPMFALWSWIFFRQDQFFFAEHMVVNTFLLGMQNFIFIPFAPFMFTVPAMSFGYVFASIGYQVWVYYSVFSGSTGMRITRGTLSAVFSVVSYSIILGILMAIIAIILVMPMYT